MRCLTFALVSSITLPALVYAADVPRGEVLDPAHAADWVIDADALWGADHPLAGQSLVIDRRGHITGLNRLGAQAPRPLAEVGVDPVIAPFWASLDGGDCRDDARPAVDGVHPRIGHVEAGFDDETRALTVGWIGIPRPDCAPETRATFAVTLRPAGESGLEVTFMYEALPADGEVAPRAGVVVGGEVFELLPDRGAHTPPDRAKALLSGSSDGERGVWTFELGAAGALDISSDPDGDGVRSVDNCEEDFNPLQENNDAAIEPDERRPGDVCDSDDDNDQIRDPFDNCRLVRNSDQSDVDGDGVGDLCDDDDGDGLLDIHDLCPAHTDPAQLDLDGDHRGDACDADIDGDDFSRLLAPRAQVGLRDLCPYVPEIGQPDRDGDGIGDGCDARPARPCQDLYCMLDLDSDGDGLIDFLDLCPTSPDRAFDWDSGEPQRDMDGDGDGDLCDPDGDGDGVLDIYQQFGAEPRRIGLMPGFTR